MAMAMFILSAFLELTVFKVLTHYIISLEANHEFLIRTNETQALLSSSAWRNQSNEKLYKGQHKN